MQRFLFVVTVFVAASLIAGCQSGPAPTPTEAATLQPTSAPTFTRTPPPTWTPTPEPTQLPTETPTPAPTATPVPEEVWVNSASGLNLRAEPSTTAKSVAALKQRQHLVVIGPANGPDANGITWQNVRTDEGQAGWASAQFLTKTNPAGGTPAPTVAAATTAPPPTAAPAVPAATAAPPSAASGEAWVNAANGLNLRAQAVSTSTVIVVLPFGAHVALTAAPQGPDAGGVTWQNVRADDGKTGFVAAQFLSATKPVTTTTPVTSTVPATAYGHTRTRYHRLDGQCVRHRQQRPQPPIATQHHRGRRRDAGLRPAPHRPRAQRHAGCGRSRLAKCPHRCQSKRLGGSRLSLGHPAGHDDNLPDRHGVARWHSVPPTP